MVRVPPCRVGSLDCCWLVIAGCLNLNYRIRDEEKKC